MTTFYCQAIGWLKNAEEDIYDTGCTGPSTVTGGDTRFIADTPQELITHLMQFCDVSNENDVIKNACDEIGRLDIQVYETGEGLPASPHQIEEWKSGRMRLWFCTYTFEITRIHEEPFDLTN